MKARVKATRRIIQVMNVMDEKGNITEPDYWEKLKHQAAISAMQGLLSNSAYLENFRKYSMRCYSLEGMVSTESIECATALINKLKEGEK